MGANQTYKWVKPTFNKVEIMIKSIDRIGLITVTYNQPLDVKH